MSGKPNTSRKPNAASLAAALALASPFAYSASSVDDYLTVSGFGTLGGVHSSYSEADFIATVEEPNGAGYSSRWTATPDSDLGLQANLKMTDALSAVVQVLSRDDEDGNFKPNLEWANLKYDFTPDLSLRVGRILLPTYQSSDIRNVGYSLPWVRVPVEITYACNASHSDGADLLYRARTGELTQDLELQWGTITQDLPGEAYTSVRSHIALVSDTLRYGDLSVHLAYQESNPIGIAAIHLHLVALGATYDPGPWFLTGDSNYTHDPYFGDLAAWYLSAGARIGRVAPYALYSKLHAGSAGSSGLEALGDEHTVGVGVRWDFLKNVDLKVQLERVTLDSLDDTAAFSNLQPGARVGDAADVLSLALDFVF
jgi:predicted porin